jgi:hypothetical protein
MEMISIKSHARIDSCTQSWFICGKNKKNIGSQNGQTDKKTFKKDDF